MTDTPITTPAEALEAAAQDLTDDEARSFCLSYRHDFGLLPPVDQEALMQEARAWHKALSWRIRALSGRIAAPEVGVTEHVALVKWLRDPWRKCDNVARGPIPDWVFGLMQEAANVIETIQPAAPVDLEARIAAPVATWKGPGEKPHDYCPDYQAMGDCRVCGHTYEAHFPKADLAQPAAQAVAEAVAGAYAAAAKAAGEFVQEIVDHPRLSILRADEIEAAIIALTPADAAAALARLKAETREKALREALREVADVRTGEQELRAACQIGTPDWRAHSCANGALVDAYSRVKALIKEPRK